MRDLHCRRRQFFVVAGAIHLHIPRPASPLANVAFLFSGSIADNVTLGRPVCARLGDALERRAGVLDETLVLLALRDRQHRR